MVQGGPQLEVLKPTKSEQTHPIAYDFLSRTVYQLKDSKRKPKIGPFNFPDSRLEDYVSPRSFTWKISRKRREYSGNAPKASLQRSPHQMQKHPFE